MAERQRQQALSPLFRLGFPLLAAVALTTVLLPLFPSGEMTDWALHPAAIAGISWAGQLWYVGQNLAATAIRGSAWGQLFGLANLITMLRGGLYAVVGGFVVVPAETALAWVPALCYGTGVVLDRLDGAVARTVGEQTPLGTRLDTAFDTFGFVVAPLVAVLWGQLPAWYLSISAARYVYRGGLSWRRLHGRPVFERPDSEVGKYLAGVQMVFVTLALAPAVPTGLVWSAAAFVLAPSLAVFARDFLVASGRWGDTSSED
jgi:CDP-diacylglycerol--glycerol-3-phosphate 3-phosphatidyltransferase